MFLAVLAAAGSPACGDGPQDNLVENVRRIPKLGVEVAAADREELEGGLDKLARQIAELRQSTQPQVVKLLPDVLIFHRAVDQALQYQEFFDAKEIPVAKKLLEIGQQRAAQLLAGEAPWTTATGLVVKGYVSKIDNTVQPYGLVVPEGYDFAGDQPHRLDLWFHGRGETLSEVNFINQRLNSRGEFTPDQVIVLHPYGRYCNANKLAGEIDTFEALDSAKSCYRIDPQRIAVRGFSMGGAACWQFAVHYPGQWFAANPGAGFSESPEFLKVFQNETLQPTWYEQKLWRMYDCTGYAANLAFLPTVAYSGEIDKQKQAADIMETALKAEGLPLLHIIGPMTAHKIHADSKVEIDRTLSQWEQQALAPTLTSPLPADGEWQTVEQFVTYTLRYNQSRYLTVDGLQEHWEPARVVVQRSTANRVPRLRVLTSNVAAFSLDPRLLEQIQAEAQAEISSQMLIDGQPVTLGTITPAAPLHAFHKAAAVWRTGSLPESQRKRAGLQGPIDDAFLDAFIFVKPTSKGMSEAVDKWALAEFEHAVEHWRRHYRGDARVKLDTEVTADDLQSANIVLFGDPLSNAVLRQLYQQLPITWQPTEKMILAGDQKFPQEHHTLIAIAPNPLAPQRYVVLNSGFTFREYDYLNNARQTPKLPDWAIVDVRTPANSRFPGQVVAADFFDENWKLKPAK